MFYLNAQPKGLSIGGLVVITKSLYLTVCIVFNLSPKWKKGGKGRRYQGDPSSFVNRTPQALSIDPSSFAIGMMVKN